MNYFHAPHETPLPYAALTCISAALYAQGAITPLWKIGYMWNNEAPLGFRIAAAAASMPSWI